ncbi:hypothetical protein C8Q75DRAFT_802985 [Abortiporus biennis]|nr:hypothetical protein C8Q75DRAFT_802985 [Abortiporus biennis]
MSRQYDPNSSAGPTPKSSQQSSPLAVDSSSAPPLPPTSSEQPSSSPQSPHFLSSSSEGYPSWLPKRPPPPAPRSTIHSTSIVGMFNEPGTSASTGEPFVGGRKPTPRSVRVVSLQNSTQGGKDAYGRREPTDPSRFSGPAHARVWSRATSAGLTPTVFSSTPLQSQLPRPRFHTSSFHPELLRNPSWKMRLWYFLFPLFVFAHIPLQTFFDFNAVFILLTVAKFPNPAAPGVPGSGRNWALGAAAYIACWFTQIFVVFIVYELVYSFIRRWRIKRPLIIPIYLSSPAFNFAAMSSYSNFCFMYFIRISAFPILNSPRSSSSTRPEDQREDTGSIRDGLAETFYFYSQNLPTVALLLPRAALSLALLLAFSSSNSSLPVGDAGVFSRRDGTFFRAENGTLTGYARDVLIANAAWTAWRILVLLISWVGLWVLSGQGCAGLCGPRYRWEEEETAEAEKAFPNFTYADNASENIDTPLPWTWRENTVVRVYEAWDFCLTNKLPTRGVEKKEGGPAGFDGMEKVFAAVGLGGTPHPARRGVLTERLFDSPEPHTRAGTDATQDEKARNSLPPSEGQSPREKKTTTAPSSSYPFTAYGAQISSSSEEIPFPPSPALEVPITDEEGIHEHEHDAEEEEEEEEEHDEEEEEDIIEESEGPSSDRRTSTSMSSLGRPVASRYPFSFRRPARGGSVSSASQMPPPTNASTPRSHKTHSSNPSQSQSAQSRSTKHSHSTQSTGNVESSDSPLSRANSSSVGSPFSSISGNGAGIPMPPRHTRSQHRRNRAGTVPAASPAPSSPSPVAFPGGRPRARTRTESVGTDASMTFGPIPLPSFDYSDDDDDHDHHFSHGHDESLMDVPEAEGSIEEAEQQDSVGLLSASASPRASLVNLRHLGSGLSLHHRGNRSRSRSATSRSRTDSSRSESARSRAQSLIQSISAASRSSVDIVRSRASSMARLSDSPYYSTSPDPQPSSPENHTFGHPLRDQWRAEEEAVGPISDDDEAKELEEQDTVQPTSVPLPASGSSESVSPPPSSHAQTEFHSVAGGSHQPERSLRSTASDISRAQNTHTARIAASPIPIPGRRSSSGAQQYSQSQPDLSTAHQSFVTAPATIEGTTDSSGRTPSSWGGLEQYGQVQGKSWQPA